MILVIFCTFLFSYNAKNTIHEISHILGVNLLQSYFCAYLNWKIKNKEGKTYILINIW